MDTLKKEYLCPVCGYDLGFPPWKGDSSSDEICPSCGIQFGYDDAAGYDRNTREAIYQEWREIWIKSGMSWEGYRNPPSGWDPVKQLKRIGVSVGPSTGIET